jgi:transposase InsO family protein
MDLGEQAHRVRFMIRDRGSNYTAAFDAVLADAGIRTVLCNVRTPRMNAIAERWIGGCRRELLDRALIWNENHLRRILREYEAHHNQHRPHRVVKEIYGAELYDHLARIKRDYDHANIFRINHNIEPASLTSAMRNS